MDPRADSGEHLAQVAPQAEAGPARAVLRLLGVDGVAANDIDTGFPGLLRPAAQDLRENRHRRYVARSRKAHDVEGQDGPSAHGIDIAKGVGAGDCHGMLPGTIMEMHSFIRYHAYLFG